MMRLVSVLGLAAFLFLGWSMIRSSAPTYDEPVHLAAGYSALRNGTRLINAMDHPPLAEMWAALPLLVLRPAVFFQHRDWLAGRVYNYADFFLYQNRLDAERMLDTARMWCLLSWGLPLLFWVVRWARRLGGGPAAAAGAVLLGLCPPLFSNAALVTTDAGASVFFFLTFAVLQRDERSLGCWLGAGAAMGAALACKFNMFVVPVFVSAMLLAEWNLRRREGVRFPAVGLTAALTCAALVLAAAYRFYQWPLYWDGLRATVTRLGEGRASFFFGQNLIDGTLAYFPAALAIKTPLPLLFGAGAGLCALWEKVIQETARAPRAGRLMDLAWLIAPPGVYFMLACFSKTQIGYRHILPVYPFLVVAGAVGAAWAWRRTWGRASCLVLGIWLAASVLRSFPSYLTYFNETVGGPTRGYRCLVDSNLDWGQGLKPLAEDLRRMGNPPVFLSYFGVADPSYYGIRYVPVGMVSNVDPRAGNADPGGSDRVLFAISVTNLQATYFADHALFAWLKARRPVLTAGNSIFLYDLTDDAEGALRLAAIVEKSGNPTQAAKLRQRYVRAA
jgi:hypothetical protein